MSGAGYSGTPLGKKLGYRGGMRVFVDGMPDSIQRAVEESIDAKPDWRFILETGLEIKVPPYIEEGDKALHHSSTSAV